MKMQEEAGHVLNPASVHGLRTVDSTGLPTEDNLMQSGSWADGSVDRDHYRHYQSS